MRQSILMERWFYSPQYFIRLIFKHFSFSLSISISTFFCRCTAYPCIQSNAGNAEIKWRYGKNKHLQEPESNEKKKKTGSVAHKKWWRGKEFYYYIPLRNLYFVFSLSPRVSSTQLNSTAGRCAMHNCYCCI